MTTGSQARTDVDKALLGHGFGAVPITTMIRSGATFDVLGAILIVVFLPLMVSLLGLGAP